MARKYEYLSDALLEENIQYFEQCRADPDGCSVRMADVGAALYREREARRASGTRVEPVR